MNRRQSRLTFLFVVLGRLSWNGLSDKVPCIKKEFVEPVANKALLNHVISTPRAKTAEICEIQCFIKASCESYNFGPNKDGDHVCELSDSDGVRDPDDLVTRQDFLYRPTKNPCATNQCSLNSRCYSDFEYHTHLCVCQQGFTGENCQTDVNECSEGSHTCHLNALCNNSEGSYSCQCKDGYKGDGFLCEERKSCTELHQEGWNSSGIYTINPDDGSPIQVLCDMKTDRGGWTVFQRRLDGSVDFFLGWESYKNGFGNLSGEFWLGNNNLHRLTAADDVKLRVDLEDFDGNVTYAEYATFKVADEADKYRLLIGGYSGTAGDSMIRHSNMQFSTKDQDNDRGVRVSNCAQHYKGVWWYISCHHSNLNGLYLTGPHASFAHGVNWKSFRGYHYSLKRTEMKVKTKV